MLTGLHHVTAFAGNPGRHAAFYRHDLGLRLVKRTVNFDDPTTYHLYYGDEHGSPGTLITHFPHLYAKPGRHGVPEILVTRLAVPDGSLAVWRDRLDKHRPAFSDAGTALAVSDPDGMRLELIETPARGGYAGGGVPDELAITGVHSVGVHLRELASTIDLLTDALGFRVAERDDRRAMLSLGERHAELELVADPTGPDSKMSAGTVHHVAWRVADDDAQAEAAGRLRSARIAVTPVLDRHYFRSIYFRIPGGVVFEIATDGPGFAVDEPPAQLGESLMLPPQYEHRRSEIEAQLAPID